MSLAEVKRQQELVRAYQARLLRPRVPPSVLVDACAVLQPVHLADTALERAISRLCGYPVCGEALEARGQGSGLARMTPGPGFTRADLAQGRKIGEPTEAHKQANFCSARCWKASVYLMAQMLGSAVVTRGSDGKPIPVELLWVPPSPSSAPAQHAEKAGAGSTGATSAAAPVPPATGSASAASTSIQARLDALSHGEVSKLAQQLTAELTIQERHTQHVPLPAAGGAEGSSEAREGGAAAATSSLSRLDAASGAYISSVEGHESRRGGADSGAATSSGSSSSGSSRFAQQRQRAAAASHHRTTQELEEAAAAASQSASAAAPRRLAPPAPLPPHLAALELVDVGARYRAQKEAERAAAAACASKAVPSPRRGHTRYLGNARPASSVDDPTVGRKLPVALEAGIKELQKTEATQETLAAYAKLVAVAMQGVAAGGGEGGGGAATSSPPAGGGSSSSDDEEDTEATIARLAEKLPFMTKKKREAAAARGARAAAAVKQPAPATAAPSPVAAAAQPATQVVEQQQTPVPVPAPASATVSAPALKPSKAKGKGVRWAADVKGSGAEGPRPRPAENFYDDYYDEDDEEDNDDDYEWEHDPEVYGSLWANLEGGGDSDSDDSFFESRRAAGGRRRRQLRDEEDEEDEDKEEDEEDDEENAGGAAAAEQERGRIVAVLAGEANEQGDEGEGVMAGLSGLAAGRSDAGPLPAAEADGTLLGAAVARADGTTDGVLPVFAPLRRFGMAGISVVSVAWDCFASWHTPETAAVLAGTVATEEALTELVKRSRGASSGSTSSKDGAELSPEVAASIARGDYLLTALRKVVPQVRELYVKAASSKETGPAAAAAAVAAVLPHGPPTPATTAFADRLELTVKSFSLHEPIPVLPQSLWLLIGGVIVAAVAGLCAGVEQPLAPITAPLLASLSTALASSSSSSDGEQATAAGLEGVIPRVPEPNELLWLAATLAQGPEAEMPAPEAPAPAAPAAAAGGPRAAANAAAAAQVAALAAAKKASSGGSAPSATRGSLFSGAGIEETELALLEAARRQVGGGRRR